MIPTLETQHQGCDVPHCGFSSWMAQIIRRQHEQLQRQCVDGVVSSSDMALLQHELYSPVIVADNAKRPISPISESSLVTDIPALVPYYNTVTERTKKRLNAYNEENKVSAAKRRMTRKASSYKNNTKTTCKLVLDRWQSSSSLKNNSGGTSFSMYPMPSLPVRLTIESPIKDSAVPVTHSPNLSIRCCIPTVSPPSSGSPSNDIAPKKPLRFVLPSLPSLDFYSSDVDEETNERCNRAASTLKVLEEALNLIAITNQIINVAGCASDDSDMD